MSILYERMIRPVLFSQEAEKMHEYALLSLKLLGALGPVCDLFGRFTRIDASEQVELFGLSFPNRVGLAAGFDKNGECTRALSALGFGHIEVGTVTRQKQPGNPRPRIFRYPEYDAIINRMGFNNEGAEAVAERLAKMPAPGKRRIPIGINIGKTKVVPLEGAVEDYLGSFHLLADHADYLSVNVSSPNTPDLRKLQDKDHLPALLEAIMTANRDRARKMGRRPIPLLLKIAPDLTFAEIDCIVETLLEHELDGIIATNTTIDRPHYLEKLEESGGLSGIPLHRHSLEIIRYIHKSTEGKLPIIGVGGIHNEVQAGAALDAGASLVQIYTGMIYKGPFLARNIAKGLHWSHNDWL